MVIDRPEEGPAFVMALSISWTQVREWVQFDLDITKFILAARLVE